MRKDSLSYTDIYEILKASPKIKDGSYTHSLTLLSSDKSILLTSGSYKNNLKDGTWKEYDTRSNLLSEGDFTNGKRTGLWNYYNNNKLVNTYDFDKDSLVFHNWTASDTTDLFNVIIGTDTLITVIQRPPVYLNEGNYRQFLNSHLRFPARSMEQKKSGSVYIRFTVDENGHARDHHILRSLSMELDEEALRVLKLVKDDWIPAKFNGKLVPVMIVKPITFNFF